MAPLSKNASPADLATGALLQCLEAATLGMPFEVWKTRMGRFRQETTIEAFKNVYKQGGGMGAFWRGTSAKMVESASKGSILLFSKEAIANSLLGAGVSQTTTGFLAGAGGGVCQVVVMGPCTFLITAAVTATDGKHVSVTDKAAEVWKAKGIKGFYPGGTAIAFRQATNWACRQGFTDGIREQFRRINHGGDQKAKLSVGEEVASGIIGGALSCINHPFEVARIEMQAAASAGEASRSMIIVMSTIVKTEGMGGLFKGVVPRIGLGIWQTLFMVTGAKMVKEHLDGLKK